MTAPADRGEPGPRACHGRCRGWSRDVLAPPIEQRRRRAAVQATFSPAVFPPVHQYVDEGVAYRARRAEGAGMVTVAPYRPRPPEGAIYSPRDADGDPPGGRGRTPAC